ncbi:MAG: glutathione S-transferase [Aquabacterium sp.]
MIIVHHLENSRSQRVLWLLEELGAPYEVRRHARDPETMLGPPALLRVHPLGKSPVIVDGDIVVAETGAIVEYLLDRFPAGDLRPAPGTEVHRRWRYWLHFAEGSAMPPLLLKLVFDRIAAAPVAFFVKPVVRAIVGKVMAGFVTPNLKSQMDFIEQELATRDWLAGPQFTAADIMMSFPLEVAVQRAGLDGRRPRLQALVQRLHARPAYQRALQRGGPYAYADAI